VSATAPARAVRWSASRLASAVVLAGWAVMLWWLVIAGRWPLFLSPRTFWVLPMGATLVTAGAAAAFLASRAGTPRPLGAGRAWGLFLLAVPVVVVLALPPSSLGSFAASRRSGVVGTGFVPAGGTIGSGPITLLEVAAAENSPAVMGQLAGRAGSPVTFEGIVSRDPDTPADEFLLTRFVVTCCLEDALVIQVRVVDVTPGKYPNDQWVSVRGPLYPVGTQVILDAQSVRPIPRPSRPYLTP
jgi:uncharacterized repeat protein (TIGR03943 family)